MIFYSSLLFLYLGESIRRKLHNIAQELKGNINKAAQALCFLYQSNQHCPRVLANI